MLSFSRRVVAVVVMAFLAFSAFALPSHARGGGPAGFADLAEKLLPAVVNISTTQSMASREEFQDMPEFQFPPGSPFEDFFRDFMEKNGKSLPLPGDKQKKQKKQKATSLGSGFVIDPAGYIVTNNHVIQDADEINVILQDNTSLSAKLVGRDKKTDLALLKVESKKPLVAVSWGESDKIRVGDWVLAIGNPFGLGGTVTSGIISARARDINSGPYDDYLQTDAPINRGNSGGPMFNMDGEVIGVNAAIFSPSGGSVGIGFAIPSSLAKGVVEQLKATGKTRRGWLGVRIQTVTPEIAESLGIGQTRGALVSSVTPNSPAAASALKAGDVIVAFDGKEVPDMHRLPRIVAETDVDKTVPVTVVRDGKEMVVQVKVGELESNDEEENKENEEKETAPAKPRSDKIETLDINVAALTEALRGKYELPKGTSGLLVMDVNPDGMAAEAGIQQGDVISEVAQQPAKSSKALADAVKKAKKEAKPLLLLIDRKGDLRFVAINPSGKKK